MLDIKAMRNLSIVGAWYNKRLWHNIYPGCFNRFLVLFDSGMSRYSF